ncbi:MAG: sulfotransferase domain-containing protein [Verrucomicrobiaceae bacterium]|nr:sulfotransferase domain-containing protein [Verrucomicrobiaceae bacterium]
MSNIALITFLAVQLALVVAVYLNLRHRIKRLERKLQDQKRTTIAGSKLATAPSTPTQSHETRTLKFQGGQQLQVNVPPGLSSKPSIFVMGPHKSGTVLFNSIMAKVAHHAGYPTFDLPGSVFRAGLQLSTLINPEEVLSLRGICFLGFRTTGVGGVPMKLESNAKAVAIIRDPRDMLTSLFFSEGKSHSVPESGPLRDELLHRRESMTGVQIDDWILNRAPDNARTIAAWADWIDSQPRGTVRVWRYEDVIFHKAEWIQSVVDWLGWEVSADIVARVADEHDHRPDSEDTSKHIRRVAPGDHKGKLTPETVAELNHLFKDVIHRWGYDSHSLG